MRGAALPGLLWLTLGACSGTRGDNPSADAADAQPTPDAAIADIGPSDASPADVPPDTDDLTVPATILRPGGERSLQHLDCMVNPDGEGIAVWRETERDGTPQIWASHLTRSRLAWEAPRQLGVRTAAEIDRISVAIDRNGRALAVWNETGGAEDGVVGVFFKADTGWTDPARVAPGWFLSLVSHPDGQATAFGVLEGTPTTLLRFLPATGWQVDDALKVDRPGFFFASPLGNAVQFWNVPATAASNHELMLSEYAAGTWTPPTRLQEPQPFDHPFPMVNAALATDGSGLAIWNRGGEAQGELWASARNASGWAPPHRLKDGESALWTTTVLISDGGNGLIVWETGNPPKRKIWSALHLDQAFQPASMLGEGSELVTGAVAKVGSGTTAVVAWSTIGNVILRRWSPTTGWEPAKAASGRNGGVADLCATLDAQGRARALWISGSPQTVKTAQWPPSP
jgi:hypothetical protein